MVKVETARQLIFEHTAPLGKYRINLSKGSSHYLAEDLFSPMDLPPFRQSAMDGYALCLKEGDPSGAYTLKGEVKAGDSLNPTLRKGEAVRIFTGAAVPDSANAVVMQEKVVLDDTHIQVDEIALHDNIRPRGEQIQKGELALSRGTYLNAAAIGFLASLGILEIEVHKKPKIAILVTGDELISSGKPLEFGKIYASNGIMLYSALKQQQFEEVSTFKVEDDLQKTQELLQHLIKAYDMVLATGGISVGEYDFVGRALQDLQVRQVFYKIRQKPGKPLYFGSKGATSIFGLPGNPAAALSCFYVYVLPALRKMSGDPSFPNITNTLAASNSVYIKKGNRAQFLKARVDDNRVSLLEGQGSAMLQSFADANALVYLPEDQGDVNIGDMLQLIPITQ